MWRTADGSTGRLLQLCFGYFSLYVLYGLASKYFPGAAADGFPGVPQVAFLVYTTLAGTAVALTVVLAGRWYRLASVRPVTWGRVTFPGELLYIVPSGVCTAVVIPTTTLMYLLPISVMVAMVIMRGSVIVISRVVDEIQIRQGLLDKRVYREENIAVAFAILAVAVNVFYAKPGDFDFVGSPAAMTILTSYIVAYSVRIYIMNFYKNTRGKGRKLDNKGFFAVEQMAASMTLLVVALAVYHAPARFGGGGAFIEGFRGAIRDPHPAWGGSMAAGLVFGAVSFFSVFLFMFKGRTATFAGLVNRLTSLVAGTASTLLFALVWGGRYPSAKDWIALALILVAVAFLSVAERRRVDELRRAHELEPAPATGSRLPA